MPEPLDARGGTQGKVSIRESKPTGRYAFHDGQLKDALRRAGFGTPRSAVDAVILDVLGPNNPLLGVAARRAKRPSRKSSSPDEREQADKVRSRHNKTLTQIARALHCEGFDEFAAMGTLHYAQTRLWGDEWREKAEEKRRTMAESVHDLSAEQRKAIGRFIHQQAAASFEAGLRIGLMASLWTLALRYEQNEKGDK